MEDGGVKIDTIEKLAVEMQKGFARTDERFVQQDQKIGHIEEVVDALAMAVAHGFEEVHNEFFKVRAEMKAGFELTATKVEMNKGFEGVNARI